MRGPHLCALWAKTLNIAEQPQQAPQGSKFTRSRNKPKFFCRPAFTLKKNTPSGWWDVYIQGRGCRGHICLRIHRTMTNCLQTPDAAQSIIQVAELKAGGGGFPVWGTHLGGFYDFPDKKKKKARQNIKVGPRHKTRLCIINTPGENALIAADSWSHPPRTRSVAPGRADGKKKKKKNSHLLLRAATPPVAHLGARGAIPATIHLIATHTWKDQCCTSKQFLKPSGNGSL